MDFLTTLKRDETGIWIARCPAFPGCVSQGNTREEATAHLREAIRERLGGRTGPGLPLPFGNWGFPQRATVGMPTFGGGVPGGKGGVRSSSYLSIPLIMGVCLLQQNFGGVVYWQLAGLLLLAVSLLSRRRLAQ